MADAMVHERQILEQIAAALDRAEAAAAALRAHRDRAEARATRLDAAGTEAVAALDALLAEAR